MFMLLQQYKVHVVNGIILHTSVGRPVRARGHYKRTRDESHKQWKDALNSIYRDRSKNRNCGSSYSAFRVELYDRDEEEYNKKVSFYMKTMNAYNLRKIVLDDAVC